MRRLVYATLSALVFIACSLGASAKTIHVPADQPTIQAGIDAAVKGDVVLVSPGTYKENINFNGKKITVKSAKGAGKTVIDGQLLGPVVSIVSGETRKSVLRGFTLQDGNGFPSSGGGVNISAASPTIINNILTKNCGRGMAILINGNAPRIESNLIIANKWQSPCGGYAYATVDGDPAPGARIAGNVISANDPDGMQVSSYTDAVVIENNVISHNAGLGVRIYGGPTPTTFVQNVVTGNAGAGVYLVQPSITFVNNTVANNAGYSGSEIYADTMNAQITMQNNMVVGLGNDPVIYCNNYDFASVPVFANNDLFGAHGLAYGGACPDLTGDSGNISADPLFAAVLSDNLHLGAGSPAIDAGDNTAAELPALDIDGDPRIVNNLVDIGGDEYTANTRLTLSSYGLRFSEQDVGTQSDPQMVTLTNHSGTDAKINLIATAAEFSQTNNCGSRLAGGASCDISIRFSPDDGGIRVGALGILTTASESPLVVGLAGTALVPKVNINPEYIDFAGVVIGTKASQPSVLTNVGQAPLVISNIKLDGPADFSQTNDCPIAPSSLAVGASCTFTITWIPVVVGNENATITITDDASPSDQTIFVSGQSYSAGVATLTPDNLTFPETGVGDTSDPEPVTLTNTGTGLLGISSISSPYTFPYQTDCPNSLPAGSSCTINVSFAPTNVGDNYGYLNVYTDSPYSAQAYLTGTASAPVPTINSISPSGTPVNSKETYVTLTGTGFISGSQAFLDDTLIATYCCDPSTQFSFWIPESYLQQLKTARIHVTNPSPGGGDSNPVSFTVYTPINYAIKSTDYRYHKIAGTNLDLQYYYAAVFNSPFPIQFGGGSYTFITVGAGGTISFSGYANEYNQPIPISDATIIVAPFWSALYPWGNGNDNNVFWAVEGTAPDRKLIIEWRNVGYCCETSNTIKFQVVFFEGNSNILFNYADTIFGGQYSSNDNGATATAGVQVAPNLGTQFSYNTPSLMSKTSLLWYPDQSTAIVSSSVLDFGYHVIGTWSLPQTLTLTNGGLVPLNINSISIDNPDYAQTNDCGTNLPPHKYCTIRVKFKPSQPNGESATLTIDDDAIGGPQHVTLNGTGAIQPIVIFPLALHFGAVQVGQKNTMPVTLANAANSDLSIEQIVPLPNVFTQTNNCGTALAPGAYCTINVTFAPTQKGQVNGKLSMGLNGKPVTSKVKLAGTGK